jgi:hypothetical protein
MALTDSSRFKNITLVELISVRFNSPPLSIVIISPVTETFTLRRYFYCHCYYYYYYYYYYNEIMQSVCNS